MDREKERQKGEETLFRVYDEKAMDEVVYGVTSSFVGKDLWVAEQLEAMQIILDIGCGSGRMIQLLKGKMVYGVEISNTWVELCRSAGYKDVKICDVSNQNIPFEDGFFDGAMCLELLEHLLDPVHALAEMNRVLRSDGLLAITSPNIAFILSRLALLFGHLADFREATIPSQHIRYYTFNSMGRLLKGAGFKVLRLGGYPRGGSDESWGPPLLARLWRPCLWLLAKLRPQLFAPSIVLLAQKVGPPERQQWQYLSRGKVTFMERVKEVWSIT